MNEINNPAQRTFWLAYDGNGHAYGVTMPHQRTTLGAGLSFVHIGTDEGQFIAACQSAGVSPVVPTTTVSARQIRLWMVQNGLPLAAVSAAIDSIPNAAQREAVRIEWEYAPWVDRSHPMIEPLASALGLTPEQVDAAFQEAMSL